MMKKIVSLLMVFAMAFSLCAITASANDPVIDLELTFGQTEFEVGADGKTTLAVKITPSTSDVNITMLDILLTSDDFTIDGINSVSDESAITKTEWATTPNLNGFAFGTGMSSAYTVTLDITVDTTTAKESISFDVDTENSWAMDAGEEYSYMVNEVVAANACAVVAPAPAGPAWEKLDNVTVVEFVGEDAEDKDYAYAVDFVANDAAKLIYSVATDNARLYSVAKDVTGLAGAIKAGFVSRTQYDAASVGVLLTNAAEDTIWYSVDADKAE